MTSKGLRQTVRLRPETNSPPKSAKRKRVVRSSDDESEDEVEVVKDVKPQQVQRRLPNEVTNGVKDDFIKSFVAKCFAETYVANTKGRRKASDLGYKIPYLLESENRLYLNPWAFSSTKSESTKSPLETEGYYTVPVNRNDMDAGYNVPADKSTKTTWSARVMVHGLFWRYWNDCAKIPEGMQVSHVSGEKTRVDPGGLTVEHEILNKSRDACHTYGWMENEDCGRCQDADCSHIRCPHIPCCQAAADLPLEEEDFKRKGRNPLGIAAKAKYRARR